MVRQDALDSAASSRPADTRQGPLLGGVRAVVVTFDSGPEILRLWQALRTEIDGLVIVDNGSAAALVAELSHIAQAEPGRVRLIANDENRGLAAAQNQGILAALGDGAEWILLLDDDSLPQPGFLAALTAAATAAPQPARIAILAPAIRQPAEAGETRYWFMTGRWHVVRRRLGAAPEEDALFVIASGSLVRAATLRTLGLMREDFFIDYVDVEFGLRLRQAGWRILLVPDAVLEHRLGDPARHALGAWSFKSSNHDAARRFTIFRNRTRLWRAYLLRRPGWVAADVAAAGSDLLRILCFERDKAAKLAAACRGLWHGFWMPPLPS